MLYVYSCRLLFGERPYWWIHTSGVYNKDNMPEVEQFRLTCETGPGREKSYQMITSNSIRETIRKHRASGGNLAGNSGK